MKRFRRWLFNGLTAISLILLASVLGVWEQSYTHDASLECMHWYGKDGKPVPYANREFTATCMEYYRIALYTDRFYLDRHIINADPPYFNSILSDDPAFHGFHWEVSKSKSANTAGEMDDLFERLGWSVHLVRLWGSLRDQSKTT